MTRTEYAAEHMYLAQGSAAGRYCGLCGGWISADQIRHGNARIRRGIYYHDVCLTRIYLLVERIGNG